MVISSCEVAGVTLCAHRSVYKLLRSQVKDCSQASGHVFLACSQSLSLTIYGCCVSLCNYTGRQVALPLHMAQISEALCHVSRNCAYSPPSWADNCKELQWGTHIAVHMQGYSEYLACTCLCVCVDMWDYEARHQYFCQMCKNCTMATYNKSISENNFKISILAVQKRRSHSAACLTTSN